MRTKAFSILELLIVIALIGILAAVSIPTLIRTQQKHNFDEAVAAIRDVFDDTHVAAMSSRLCYDEESLHPEDSAAAMLWGVFIHRFPAPDEDWFTVACEADVDDIVEDEDGNEIEVPTLWTQLSRSYSPSDSRLTLEEITFLDDEQPDGSFFVMDDSQFDAILAFRDNGMKMALYKPDTGEQARIMQFTVRDDFGHTATFCFDAAKGYILQDDTPPADHQTCSDD